MNIKELKEMIQLMNENALTELELEKDGLKIKMKKAGSHAEPTVIYETRSAAPNPSHGTAAAAKETPKAPPAQAKTVIKSPMVGTFYSAPAPDAPPFVQAGSPVEPGQVICIIEAMKLMNEIKAEVRGKISQVLVNNGDPVEFGQPLFELE